MLAKQYQLLNFDVEKYKRVFLSSKFTSLPLTAIVLPKNQPRRYFDSQKLSKLTESIRQNGVLEPVLVRPLSNSNDIYELVAGERRYQAAQEAGLTEIPAAIHKVDDEEALTISLVENLHREDLNPVEETEAILSLLCFRLEMTRPETIRLLYRMRHETKGQVGQNVLTSSYGQTIKAVFDSIGLISWESFITSRLPLLKLPEDILEVLRQGQVAYTKALALAKVHHYQQRQALTCEAINQNLSLSEIRQRIKELNFPSSSEFTPEQNIEARLQRITKSQVWKNPKKKEQLEQLLVQMEALISE
jgi:ParB family chromosome partitioning protein